MRTPNWLSRLFRHSRAARPQPRPRSRWQPPRLSLEPLEDRLAPATYGLTENFDGVAAPALPTNWTSQSGPGVFTTSWNTVSGGSFSAPNRAFGSANFTDTSDTYLLSPL